MKQRTTAIQLRELSKEAREKLIKWHVITYSGMEIIGEVDDIDKDFPLLSIGQMIEFLSEHHTRPDVYSSILAMLNETSYDTTSTQSFCDTLWGDVKDILEND